MVRAGTEGSGFAAPRLAAGAGGLVSRVRGWPCRLSVVCIAVALGEAVARPGGDGPTGFREDGCTAFPEGPPGEPCRWADACRIHDYRYWRGGTAGERLAADLELRRRVAGAGHPFVAAVMFAGVRLGGAPCWPTRFRWGFGWCWPRGYRALDAGEAAALDRLQPSSAFPPPPPLPALREPPPRTGPPGRPGRRVGLRRRVGAGRVRSRQRCRRRRPAAGWTRGAGPVAAGRGAGPASVALAAVVLALSPAAPAAEEPADGGGSVGVRIGVFDVDASPPLGSPLAYDQAIGVETPLRCRGVVFGGFGPPVVLCAIDWIGLGNRGQDEFKERIARAVGTRPDRVAIHALHQHDAPQCDFSAEALLAEHGFGGSGFDPEFALRVADAAGSAAAAASARAAGITHVGTGAARVDKVASNRRILGDDGRVRVTRYTATADPAVRAEPAGTIDPELKLIAFWSGGEPVVAMTYYATHPQSYYRTGLANADFPGLARTERERETGVMHVHFNGAGGNIGAGKWNDGSPENRPVLAARLADGMERAWDAVEQVPISASDCRWRTEPMLLPVAPHLDEAGLLAALQNRLGAPLARYYAAADLAWLRRCRAGDPVLAGCLELGPVRVLHLPGELFVEYQLAAQAMRPDLFVAMAAYGDYAPGYIGTEVAYSQGGYETSPRASKVAPEVEGVIQAAVARLLRAGP